MDETTRPERERSPLPGAVWRALLLGLAVREALAFWTGHPYDLEAFLRTGHAVATGQDPYSTFWPAVPGVSFAFLSTPLPSAAYPPFWPAVFGGTYGFWELLGGQNRFVLYLLLKQGPILGDLALGLLVYELVLEIRRRRDLALTALVVWLFLPYDVLISAVWGQVDSVTSALVIATLVVPAFGPVRRNLVWGFGMFVKWITVIFLPLEAFRARGAGRVVPLIGVAVGAGLALGTMVSFGWSLEGFSRTGISVFHGSGNGMNLAQLFGYPPVTRWLPSVPGLAQVRGWVWVPAVIVGGWIAARWVRIDASPAAGLRAVGFVTTCFLLTRWGLAEQYLLYLFPLLIVDGLAVHPGRRALYVWLYVLAQAYLVVDNQFLIWFASPAEPALFSEASAAFGMTALGEARLLTLVVLAVLVTVTLVQLAWTFWRDVPDPSPWPLFGRVRRTLTAGAGP